MLFHSAVAAVAGAALWSVASAGPVCRPKHGGHAQPAPNNPPNQQGWYNWNGAPMVIRTTTMRSYTQVNPQATDGPKWGGWNGGGNPAPVPTYSVAPPPQVWSPWQTYNPGPTTIQTLTLSLVTPTATTSTDGGITGNPVPGSTTTTLVTSTSSDTLSPTAISTTTTDTTITTTELTTTTTTTTTTTAATTTTGCPNAPTGNFVLRATNAENTALEGLYAGLANNGFGNLVAFSEATADTAVQVTFDGTCQLVSAVGPLIVYDDAGQFSAIHYQYMNFPGTDAPTLDARADICSADATNVLSCTVGGQTVLQTSDDILSIGDQLYYQAVTVVLEPVA